MKENKGILIWVSVFALAGLFHCPLWDILFDDKDIFRYMGMAVAKGQVPYRDFFDHKPPLIYFLNALGYLFGKWGLWIIDMTLVGFASHLLYKMGKRRMLSLPWLLPVVFNILLRDWNVSNGIGMTREYTAMLAVVFFYMALNQPRYKYFSLGILTALTFFMQQDQVVVLVPLYIWTLYEDAKTVANVLKNLLLTTAGFVAITAIILLYFAVNHALYSFWQDAFLFNFTWYSDKQPFTANIKGILRLLHDTSFEMPLIIVLVGGFGSLAIQKQNRGLLVAVLISLLVTFVPQFLSPRSGDNSQAYYFQPFSSTLCFVLLVMFTSPSLFSRKHGQLILAVMMMVLPLFNVGRYLQILPQIRQSVNYRENAYSFFEKANLKDNDLFVAFNSNYTFLYNRFKILSPTKRIYQFFWGWFPAWDKDHAIMNEIMKSLKQNQTRFILDFSEDKEVALYNNTKEYWQSFLKTYYHRLDLPVPGPKQSLWILNGVEDIDIIK